MKSGIINRMCMFWLVLVVLFVSCILEVNATSILLDKNHYDPSDVVQIAVNPDYAKERYGLEVISEGFVYRYLDLIQDQIRFMPKSTGRYEVILIDRQDNLVVERVFFDVVDGSEEPDSNEQAIVEETRENVDILVKDSSNRFLRMRANVLNKGRSTRGTLSGGGKEVHDVELLPENEAVESILFRDLDISKNLEIGLEVVGGWERYTVIEKNLKKMYAIDPTELDFSEALVTSVAEGRELIKCKEWIFNEQRCYGEWEKIMDIIPGEEYSFILNTDDPGFGESDPPSPHNIIGRVFHPDGVTGVENGIPVLINNTNNSNSVLTYVYAPPVPEYKGSYSATINGSDNDSIIVVAWNITHYGRNTSLLDPTTTEINIVLNNTRPSEANVSIIVPVNDTLINTSSSFNVSANISIIGGRDGINCNATINFFDSMIFNISSEENLTKTLGDISLGDSIMVIWNITAIGVGSSNISVAAECVNQTTNLAGVNIDYVYNISNEDTSPPVINIVTPNNGSVVARNITFLYDIEDHSEIANCSLIVNYTMRANNTQVDKNLTQNFTLFLDFGDYEFYINCTDNSTRANTGSSETRYLTVSNKDLTLNSSDILFSNQNPVENERIMINATIRNIGSENVTRNFTVQFFEGDPSSGVQIMSNITINGLNESEYRTVGVNWTAKSGTHNIYVVADAPLPTNGTVREVNESNNQANNTIFIPSYQTYFGNISASVLLDNTLNRSVYMWFNETEITGNIYVVDSDSVLTWTNLTALGINISGNNATSDFEEIDVGLNLTDYVDSINATYSENGYAKDKDNFVIYGVNIMDVPIVNSTNSSSFVTGILWDSSDSNEGEYNGTQDLVFVTTITNNEFGQYGYYDYEIKVPANLRRYIKPNNDNSITLYSELE